MQKEGSRSAAMGEFGSLPHYSQDHRKQTRRPAKCGWHTRADLQPEWRHARFSIERFCRLAQVARPQ